jgi:rSAM/selenodomain-associated transferase 1
MVSISVEQGIILLPLIIIFAKAPRPGYVKTRLGLEPETAALIHADFVRQTLQTTCQFCGEAELELSVDVPCTSWQEFSVRRSVQGEGDLGVRLYRALERGLSAGHSRVVILGSDSPTLPSGHIRFLLTCAADVVFGPTVDGGYYGIACNKIMPTIFQGVRWSTDNALRDSIVSVGRCGLSYGIGPKWFDIDRPEDLMRWRNDGSEIKTRATGKQP